MSWPWRTPSVISALRLRASAGPRPVVSSATVIGGVEAGGRLDEAGGRAGVQAELVRHADHAAPRPRAEVQRRAPAARRRILHPELRGLHAERRPRASAATSSRSAPARARRRPRRRPPPAAPRTAARLGRPSIISTAISALITALPRSISTSTPSADGRALDRRHHHHHVGPDLAGRVGHPARRLDRHVLAAHLARELDHALGERRAVGDDDEADHYEDRPAARCRISTGWTVCTPGGLLDVPAAGLGVAHRELGPRVGDLPEQAARRRPSRSRTSRFLSP